MRDALENSDNTLVVSAASAWEIATKWRLGKLQQARAVGENYPMALHRLAAVDLPISADDLVLASRDPAFAQFEGLRLLR